MEKRTSKRIETNIDVKFYSCNKEFSGRATNLSGNGMLINTRDVCFPFEQDIKVSISFKGEMLHITSRIVRMIISPDFNDRIAVTFLNPLQNYLELLYYQKSLVNMF